MAAESMNTTTEHFLRTLAPLALSGIGEGVGAIVGSGLEDAVEKILPALPPAARLVIVDENAASAEACKRFVAKDLRVGVINEPPAQFVEDMVEQRFDALLLMPGCENDEQALLTLLWEAGFMAVHPDLKAPDIEDDMMVWNSDAGAAIRMLPPRPKRRGGRRRNASAREAA